MLERIDLERVATEAHQIDIGRTLLTLVVGFFWLLGWTAGKICIVLAAAITFAAAAIKVGWQDAHKPVATRRRGIGPA
jgi:hypothetical protein